MSPSASPLVLGASPGDRARIVEKFDEVAELRREWIRRQVINNGRVDILAREALGYEIQPHHFAIAQHQSRNPEGNLVLAWRGGGKTLIGTITRAIYVLIENPNARVAVASKSMANAVAMLSEMKAKILSERFAEIFGDWRGEKWDDIEFDIKPRTEGMKERSVTAIGVESAVASKHYDVIICDDLVDQKNSRTAHVREQILTFYYKILEPCLEKVTPYGEPGQMHVLGTRFHPQDLYGHLLKEDYAESSLLIPVWEKTTDPGERKAVPVEGRSDDSGEGEFLVSRWEAKFPIEKMVKLRKRMGAINFDSQYLMSCDRMQGRIYDYDDIQWVTEAPPNLPRYMGVDLAISQKARAHLFAIVVIAYDHDRDIVYIVDHFSGKRKFSEQRKLIVDYFRRHKCAKAGVEAVAYQEAMLQELKESDPDVTVVPLRPRGGDDKEARAHRVTAKFEDQRVFFKKGLDALVDEIVAFPDGEYDDSHDALLNAMEVIRRKVKKPRGEEPGLF